MRRARRPRMLGATTKAMPVSIVLGAKRRVMKQSGDLRGPDRTRALRGSAIGLPPRRRHLDRGTAPVALTAARPKGWRACVSPLMRGMCMARQQTWPYLWPRVLSTPPAEEDSMRQRVNALALGALLVLFAALARAQSPRSDYAGR